MSAEWNEIVRQINAFEKGKKDIIVPAKTLYTISNSLRSTVGGINYTFTDHSLTQLCNKLNIPARYMKKCLEEFPELFEDNMDTWLDDSSDSFLLRTRGDSLRAVLSDRYSILDNKDVIKALEQAPNLTDKNFTVKDFYMDDHYFSLRAIFPDIKLEMANRKGGKDPVFLGVSSTNSEVGLKRACLDICLWRQVCSNGLIICQDSTKLFDQRHLWVKKDTLAEKFAVACEQIREVGKEYLEMFKATKEITLAENQIDNIIYGIDAPKEFLEETQGRFEGSNMFELINHLTDSAKLLPFEQRFEVEKYAGRLLRVA